MMHLFGQTYMDTIHMVPDRYSNIIGQNFLKPLDIVVNCKDQGILDGKILAGMTEITENKLHSTTMMTNCSGRVIPQEFPGPLNDNIGTFRHPKNVERIQTAAQSSNKKEVQVFLGMITYYADFLANMVMWTPISIATSVFACSSHK